jgi:nucleoside-diphosphate-sugar epimerase
VALRLSNVIPVERYATFPQDWADPQRRMFNLWSYIDVRDAAGACLAALTAPVTGARSYVIASTDSAMTTPSAELMAMHFPDVPLRGDLGTHESLLSGARAHEELGFVPQHSWRDHVDAPH